MSFDSNWEDNIYSQNKHINKYPYGELVSVFFNSLKYLDQTILENKKNIKVLEIGSGAGNNLWFISELGFDTYGIDGSKSACKIARENCELREVKVNIKHAYFDDLPFENDYFDIIIDRESTCCGSLNDIKSWWEEVDRVTKQGGVIISFKFSDDNPSLLKILNNEIKAEYIEKNTYRNIEKGTFKDTGIVHFQEYDGIFDIFNFCDIKSINKNKSESVYSTNQNEYFYSEWIIVGVKK